MGKNLAAGGYGGLDPLAASARAKGLLAETKESKAENEKFLADMTSTHEAKSATFEANQKVRKEELEAIDKAITIISNVNQQNGEPAMVVER